VSRKTCGFSIAWAIFIGGTAASMQGALITTSLASSTTYSDAQLGAPSSPQSGPSFGPNGLISPGNGLFTLGAQAPGTNTVTCASALSACVASASAVGGSFESGSFLTGSSPSALLFNSALADQGGGLDASVSETVFTADFTENAATGSDVIQMGQMFTGVLPLGAEAAYSRRSISFDLLDTFGTSGGLFGTSDGGLAWFGVANLSNGAPVFFGSSGISVTFTLNQDGSVNFTAVLPDSIPISVSGGYLLEAYDFGGIVTEVVDPGASINGSPIATPEPNAAGLLLTGLAALVGLHLAGRTKLIRPSLAVSSHKTRATH
jgi:hypothetical protein